MPYVATAVAKLYRDWKRLDRRLNAAAVALLVAAVVDVAASAVALGRIDAFWRLDVQIAIAEMTLIYVLILPLIIHLIQRDIQRGRADAVGLALLLILLHVMVTNIFKLGLAFG